MACQLQLIKSSTYNRPSVTFNTTGNPLQKQHSAFPPPRNPTWARKRAQPRGNEGRKVKHCCVSVGSYQLAVARAFMHSFHSEASLLTTVSVVRAG